MRFALLWIRRTCSVSFTVMAKEKWADVILL